MNSSFLVALSLDDKKCVVVGATAEADYRAERLEQAGGRVLRIFPDTFREAELDDCWLCVLADRDDELASRIAQACKARRIFFCALDQPNENTFRHVAVARAGRIQIGISTDGSAPALAKRLREELERIMTEARLAEFAERMARLRERTPSAERAEVLGRAVRQLRFDGKLDTGP
jgi:siroheme synthase (precorrin-2 oxidase/ferrochelatase)